MSITVVTVITSQKNMAVLVSFNPPRLNSDSVADLAFTAGTSRRELIFPDGIPTTSSIPCHFAGLEGSALVLNIPDAAIRHGFSALPNDLR